MPQGKLSRITGISAEEISSQFLLVFDAFVTSVLNDIFWLSSVCIEDKLSATDG